MPFKGGVVGSYEKPFEGALRNAQLPRQPLKFFFADSMDVGDVNGAGTHLDNAARGCRYVLGSRRFARLSAEKMRINLPESTRDNGKTATDESKRLLVFGAS